MSDIESPTVKIAALETQVATLTQERDEARKDVKFLAGQYPNLEGSSVFANATSSVTTIPEALATPQCATCRDTKRIEVRDFERIGRYFRKAPCPDCSRTPKEKPKRTEWEKGRNRSPEELSERIETLVQALREAKKHDGDCPQYPGCGCSFSKHNAAIDAAIEGEKG